MKNLVVILGLLCIVQSHGDPSKSSMRSLADGIIIKKEPSFELWIADWTMLFTVQTMTFPEDVNKDIERLSTLLLKINSTNMFSSFSDLWHDQLRLKKERISDLEDQRSMKHSTFDHVDKYSDIPDSEMLLYKDTVKDNQVSVANITHRNNVLLSAVKNYQLTFDEFSIPLEPVVDRIQQIYENILKTGAENLEDSKEFLEMGVTVDSAMGLIGTFISYYEFIFSQYQSQLHSLRLKHVTEELLPVEALRHVLHHSRSRGYHPRSVDWYYWNTEIQALWNTPSSITYRVLLPLSKSFPDPFLAWSFSTFPIPLSEKHKAKVNLVKRIAYNTVTGSMYEYKPEFCKGGSERICRPGVFWDRSKYQCERYLVCDDCTEFELSQHCEVEITEEAGPQITEVNPGMYAVSTQEVNAWFGCESEYLGKYVSLSAGVKLVSMPYPCNLVGPGWRIEGFSSGSTPEDYKLNTSPPSIGVHGLLASMPESKVQKLALNSQSHTIEEITDLLFQPEEIPVTASITGMHRQQVPRAAKVTYYMTWVTTVFSVLLIVVFVIGLIVWKCGKCRKVTDLKEEEIKINTET